MEEFELLQIHLRNEILVRKVKFCEFLRDELTKSQIFVQKATEVLDDLAISNGVESKSIFILIKEAEKKNMIQMNDVVNEISQIFKDSKIDITPSDEILIDMETLNQIIELPYTEILNSGVGIINSLRHDVEKLKQNVGELEYRINEKRKINQLNKNTDKCLDRKIEELENEIDRKRSNIEIIHNFRHLTNELIEKNRAIEEIVNDLEKQKSKIIGVGKENKNLCKEIDENKGILRKLEENVLDLQSITEFEGLEKYFSSNFDLLEIHETLKNIENEKVGFEYCQELEELRSVKRTLVESLKSVRSLKENFNVKNSEIQLKNMEVQRLKKTERLLKKKIMMMRQFQILKEATEDFDFLNFPLKNCSIDFITPKMENKRKIEHTKPLAKRRISFEMNVSKPVDNISHLRFQSINPEVRSKSENNFESSDFSLSMIDKSERTTYDGSMMGGLLSPKTIQVSCENSPTKFSIVEHSLKLEEETRVNSPVDLVSRRFSSDIFLSDIQSDISLEERKSTSSMVMSPLNSEKDNFIANGDLNQSLWNDI